MKLRALRDYGSAKAVHRAGAVLEVSEEEGAWYMRDAPGVFEVIPEPAPEEPEDAPESESAPEPDGKALSAPPQDRAIKRAPKAK